VTTRITIKNNRDLEDCAYEAGKFCCMSFSKAKCRMFPGVSSFHTRCDFSRTSG
jgi:hypothetical protein